MKEFLIILLVFKFVASEQPKPIIALPSGTLRGTFQQAENGKSYAAFEGIPYARPPVGKYRFRDPQPTKPWKGVWEANYLHTCLQYNHYITPGKNRVIGSEDCLYVNVYTPQLHQAAMLDVIVYIHGGAFMFGASHIYGPKIIMSRDVIYVTFNYRLGPLGFMSTEDYVVPGNMGLKDQAMALKWIKHHIQYFGGNPNSITLTGMSAGGASVHLHYMSPLSTGLFSRGFSLSGTALNSWVLAENSLQKARKLASSLGCDALNTKDMVDCMRYRPATQIVENVAQFFGFLYNPFSPFGVVIEPPQMFNTFNPSTKDVIQTFLSEHPYQLLKTNRIQNIPWLTSVVQAEGLYPASEFVADPAYLEEIAARWPDLAPAILDYNYTFIDSPNERANIAETILKEYLQSRPITKETFNELVQMIGDRLFVADSQNAAKLHARASMSPVHYYYFKYRAAHSKSESLSKSTEDFGVSHGDDTVHVLSSNIKARTTENDIKMSEVLLDLWTSYAKTGVPTVLKRPWQAVSRNPTDPLKYLEIISPTEVKEMTSEDFGKAKFWLSLPFRENHHIVNIRDEL